MPNPGILPNLNVANVYTSLSNATIYTDKVRLATGNTAITYQVYAVALQSGPAAGSIGNATPVGNLYTNPPQIPPNNIRDVYVGAQNKMTVTGTNWTATEVGTATSALSGTIGQGSR